jgi:hypothetical protein
MWSEVTMNNGRYIIMTALILAVASVFFTGAMFLFFVFGITCYLVYKNAAPEDRRFILTVLIVGFLLRLGIAMALHAASYLKGYEGSTSGDDLLYTVRSWAIVFQWEGKPYSWVQDLTGISEHGVNPFTFLMALFYKIFGFHPMAVKMINCIIGTLIGWMSYLTAREMFGRKAGRITMLIVMFYPSLLRWSIANLKDSITILSFMTIVYLCVVFLYKKMAVWQYCVLALSLLILYFFPNRFHFVLALSSIATAAGLKFSGALTKRSKVVIALGMAIILLLGSFYLISVNPKHLVKLLQTCEDKQYTVAKSDYAGYYFYPKDFMTSLYNGRVPLPELLNIIFLNTAYFMLTPFPWQMTSRERAVAYPQMLIWYAVLFFAIFGYIKLMANIPKAAFYLGILLAVGVIVHSMAEGNIGAAFRHRDIFTPIFIVLASPAIAGIMRTKGEDR